MTMGAEEEVILGISPGGTPVRLPGGAVGPVTRGSYRQRVLRRRKDGSWSYEPVGMNPAHFAA